MAQLPLSCVNPLANIRILAAWIALSKVNCSHFSSQRPNINTPFQIAQFSVRAYNSHNIFNRVIHMHIGPYQLRNNLIVAPMAGGADDIN